MISRPQAPGQSIFDIFIPLPGPLLVLRMSSTHYPSVLHKEHVRGPWRKWFGDPKTIILAFSRTYVIAWTTPIQLGMPGHRGCSQSQPFQFRSQDSSCPSCQMRVLKMSDVATFVQWILITSIDLFVLCLALAPPNFTSFSRYNTVTPFYTRGLFLSKWGYTCRQLWTGKPWGVRVIGVVSTSVQGACLKLPCERQTRLSGEGKKCVPHHAAFFKMYLRTPHTGVGDHIPSGENQKINTNTIIQDIAIHKFNSNNTHLNWKRGESSRRE